MFHSALFLFLTLVTNTQNSLAETKPLIVGGVPAALGEMPFIASLQGNYGHFCGGTLIKKQWVLTAAHCVAGGAPKQILVGLYDRDQTKDVETFRPAKIIGHPKYDPRTMDYDYALIQLAGESKLESMQLNNSRLEPNTTLTTAGWGILSENDRDLPGVLQKVEIPFVSGERCSKAYPGQITDRMLCAGFDEGGKDSCQGDSGGPLFFTENDKKFLAGVVSWGEGCARKMRYGIYSSVGEATAWIEENTK